MKIVLTCGYRYCGVEAAHRLLVAGGVAEAQPSRREGMTAASFHERMLKAHGVDQDDVGPLTQIRPGKVWEDLAADLFLGNLARDNWGFADPAVGWLLEFWKNFDPQIRFLFVYASPQVVAATALMAGGVSPQQIGEVMASWAAYQLELLRFYHRNRDRCLLVNAMAFAAAPEGFVGRVASAFELDLAVPARLDLQEAQPPSPIASVLVEGLLGESGEPQVLYAELEGYADLPEDETGTFSVGWGPAWVEYRRLIRDLSKAEAALRLQVVRYDDLALWGSETETALVEAKAEIAVQRERIEHLERLVEQSVAEWTAQVKSEADLRSTLERQSATLERQSADLTGSQQAVAALTACEKCCLDLARDLQSQRDALAAAQAALAEQEGRNSHLINDNEGMLQELHAVQEELETYFLRCQELSAAVPGELGGTPGVGLPWGPMAPVEIRFDMRGEVDGENWYYPEADGRWAGPELVSTLNLPVLGLGRYEVQLEVADAMRPDILAGTRVSINDTAISLAREGKRYPAMLAGRFSADELPADGKWRLKIEFPSVATPADRGSDDRRHLAIRLRSVKLAAVVPPGA